MPRKKQYSKLEIADPFQLQTDILSCLARYEEAPTERLIMISLVRLFENMPPSKVDAEIVALIQLLSERINEKGEENHGTKAVL